MKQLKLTCTQSVYNWILKQIFYFRYLVLKRGNSAISDGDITFESHSFDELDTYDFRELEWGGLKPWNEYLPWYKDSKAFQDWNTYGIFKQQYGKWYFKAKLDGLITDKIWPALWLLDMCSQNDVNEGRGDHPYYYEVDIELMKNHLVYSIHFSHNGEKAFETIWRSKFANRKLRRNLQREDHLFLIDWSEKWIKFYINGILTACFKNEICVPLQIICSKIEMSKTIIQK